MTSLDYDNYEKAKYILVRLPSGKLGFRKAPQQDKDYIICKLSNGKLCYRVKK